MYDLRRFLSCCHTEILNDTANHKPWQYAAYFGHSCMVKALVNMGLSLEDTNVDGETPLQDMGVANPDASDVIELYRFLTKTDELQTALQIFQDLSASPSRYPEKTIHHFFMWSVPDFLAVIMGEQHVSHRKLPPPVRFAHLSWYLVDAQVFLDDIGCGPYVDPADFRCAMSDTAGSSMQSFAQAYFERYFLIFTTSGCDNIRCTHCEEKFQPWRQLTRWLFQGASLQSDLCKESPNHRRPLATTPLFAGMIGCRFDHETAASHTESRLFSRRISFAMRLWLEDLQCAGTDLAKYAQRELELFKANTCLRAFRWDWLDFGIRDDPEKTGFNMEFMSDVTRAPQYGPVLHSFTFGPNPGDWSLKWESDAEEFAGEFWEQVENPPLHIPGTWVE